jgi:iron uptake system component EfeO
MNRRNQAWYFGALLFAVPACSNDDPDEDTVAKANTDDKTNVDYQASSVAKVQTYVSSELTKLTTAAQALQKAAPEPDDDGWNEDDDADAVAAMRKAWSQARDAYERVEGSIAVLFVALDVSTDERYDGFIEKKPDDNLFDDKGVTGVHGVERILWANSAPQRVIDFESGLEGYTKAAFPATKQEAADFKNKLCALLVTDTGMMRDRIKTNALDSQSAFWGMIGSLGEQSEKTTLAAQGEDESRYAQHTLADMRANLEGARAVFEAFKPWIEDTSDHAKAIDSGLNEIKAAYSDITGPALPEVPAKFDPDEPSADDLATPYGKLWQLLNEKTDPNDAQSLVSIMADAADSMGIVGISEEE